MVIPKISQVAMLVEDGNYSQVELYCRIILLEKPEDPHALLAIAWANYRAGLPEFTSSYMRRVEASIDDWSGLASDLAINTDDRSQLALASAMESSRQTPESGNCSTGRTLLIKAWGFGFWSDVLHVLGGLMLAEITHRKPLVHWGTNSLYSVTPDQNAWTDFFSPIGPPACELIATNPDCYPPKWRSDLLLSENVQKSKGEWSRISGLNLMGRDETVCVMDFYIGVLNLMPYIDAGSAMAGMSINQVYLYLINKYLKIKPEIVRRANDFHSAEFGSEPFLAVHVRGSDKVGEFKAVDKFHNRYQELISKQLQHLPANCKIFLMTDDNRLLRNYKEIYGDRIVTTDCLRTDSRTGVHYQAGEKITESAFEVIIDTLIASRATRFVGNGYSNPSIFVFYLGRWLGEECLLIGGNRMKHYNTHLYKTIEVI